MSLNIGNDGISAARDLRDSAPWKVLREALLEQSRRMMNAALDAQPGQRDDAVGYARALRDVYLSLEAATTGQAYQRVEKPGAVVGKTNATR